MGENLLVAHGDKNRCYDQLILDDLNEYVYAWFSLSSFILSGLNPWNMFVVFPSMYNINPLWAHVSTPNVLIKMPDLPDSAGCFYLKSTPLHC